MAKPDQSTNKGGTDKETGGEPQKNISWFIIKVGRAALIEIGLILWVCAEFFAGLSGRTIEVWLLGFTLAVLFGYIVHISFRFRPRKRYKITIWSLFWALCGFVFIGCWWADRHIREEWRLENEPRVIPPIVQLHDGKHEKLTRVLIYNPSDSWIYQLTLLVQVESNRASIETVLTALADSPGGDKFENSPKHNFPAALMGPWAMMDALQLDVFYPPESGRLLILYSMAPKENRALWIRGTAPTNSYARISVVECSKTPLSLDVDSKENMLLWPGPSSNSVYWAFFPNSVPMNLGFGETPTPTASTNTQNFLQLPTRPFRGIPLQGPPTGQP